MTVKSLVYYFFPILGFGKFKSDTIVLAYRTKTQRSSGFFRQVLLGPLYSFENIQRDLYRLRIFRIDLWNLIEIFKLHPDISTKNGSYRSHFWYSRFVRTPPFISFRQILTFSILIIYLQKISI